jgi:uncharacterized protein YjiS (DUF1127 family)
MNIAIATNRARSWSDSPLLRAGSSLGRKVAAGLRALQYAQMISVLNRLPDDHLVKVGLRRSDIPEHARRAVYGDT